MSITSTSGAPGATSGICIAFVGWEYVVGKYALGNLAECLDHLVHPVLVVGTLLLLAPVIPQQLFDPVVRLLFDPVIPQQLFDPVVRLLFDPVIPQQLFGPVVRLLFDPVIPQQLFDPVIPGQLFDPVHRQLFDLVVQQLFVLVDLSREVQLSAPVPRRKPRRLQTREQLNACFFAF
jgi:hypothetical protein